ncbi:MAG TPA: hypothetical protein VEI07_15905 [Planctomycetaceae bacterium]|nr:hypothetical protein [Planctomycetaceae bacterium]
MSETLTVGLTEEQREILLRGLRFARSAVALEVYDSTPETDAERKSKLREIRQLAEYLEGVRPAGTAART